MPPSGPIKVIQRDKSNRSDIGGGMSLKAQKISALESKKVL